MGNKARALAIGAIGAAMFFTSADALASIGVSNPLPMAGTVQGDSVMVVVSVTSLGSAVSSVTATVGGVTTPLTAQGLQYGATISLVGVAEGPQSITFAATNAAGETSSSTVAFTHDVTPKVSVSAPIPWQFYRAPQTARVTVACSDTAA